MQDGHVYIESEELLESVKRLLEENKRDVIEFTDISTEIVKLAADSKIVIDETHIYSPSLFYSEKGIVTNIHRYS